jgi:hypothetical protein
MRRGARVAALSKCDVVSIIRAAGIPEAKVAAMTCTSFYESAWNPSATNHNSNGSTDFGLFQVNNNYWCSDPSEYRYPIDGILRLLCWRINPRPSVYACCDSRTHRCSYLACIRVLTFITTLSDHNLPAGHPGPGNGCKTTCAALFDPTANAECAGALPGPTCRLQRPGSDGLPLQRTGVRFLLTLEPPDPVFEPVLSSAQPAFLPRCLQPSS